MLILSVLFEEIFSVMRQNKEYYRYKHEQYSNGCKEELQRFTHVCCGFCFNEDCIFVGACVLAAGVAVENDNAPKFFK